MKHLIKALAFSGALAALAPLAHATTISIGLQEAGYNGGAVFTAATDSTIAGLATYSGTFGSFTSSISGQGAPLQAQGSLSTNAIQTSATTAGTITVYITETGLNAPVGSTNFLSQFTSNLFTGSAISVVESTLFDTNNGLYTGTQLDSHTFTASGSPNPKTVLENVVVPYSETAKYVITVGAGQSNVNDTIDITATSAATPEPSSLILLGTGVLGAAGMLRRRFTGKSNA